MTSPFVSSSETALNRSSDHHLATFMDGTLLPQALSEPVCLANIAFLGLGASAACFVSWNYSIRVLGALRTSVYIYLTPVVTVLFSHFLLDEPFTLMICLGTILTLAGLILSSADSLQQLRRLASLRHH